MEYPKPVMRLTELEKMGFPKSFLMSVYRQRNQKIAWKLSSANNSPILFDTAQLEQFRKASCGTGRGV